MDKQALAALLNGRHYRQEITKEECEIAKQAGLVVVFGQSDDLMEFRGAIDDEVSSYGGTTAHLDASGLLENKCDCADCPYAAALKLNAKKILAIDGRDGYSWLYETDIPHVTFNVLEDDKRYCKGIIFNIRDAA